MNLNYHEMALIMHNLQVALRVSMRSMPRATDGDVLTALVLVVTDAILRNGEPSVCTTVFKETLDKSVAGGVNCETVMRDANKAGAVTSLILAGALDLNDLFPQPLECVHEEVHAEGTAGEGGPVAGGPDETGRR